MDWREIIERLEKELGMQGRRSGLAKELGVNSSIISGIKSGKSKNPGSNIALLLINKLNVNPKWLETGNEPIFLKRLGNEPFDEQNLSPKRLGNEPFDEQSLALQKQTSMPTIIGDNNTQVLGNENKITTNLRQNNEYDELFSLICDYATPKMLKELKGKLLKIKETVNG